MRPDKIQLMPKVSIIIRLKNEQEFLPKVLESLANQTYKDFEIIAVENCSTDKTLQILKDFQKELNITIVNLPANKFTYSYASNLGAQHASGEIIGYLSGHSIPILEDYIASGVKHFSDERVAGVYGTVLPSSKATLSERLYYSAGLGYKNRLRLILSQQPKIIAKPQTGLLGNTNSFIRRSLWERYPFSDLLAFGGEDTGWAIHFMRLGYIIIREPHMVVEHSHGINLTKLIAEKVGWYRMYKKERELS